MKTAHRLPVEPGSVQPSSFAPAPADSLITVVVRTGEADRIAAGHPWLFAGAIQRLTGTPADGEVVQVKDLKHRLLGVGFFNSKSRIQVRMLSPDRVPIDRRFFEERLRSALAHRQRSMPGATSFRVVNSESDFLSGLIVDKYEDVLVLQTSSLGMDQRKAMIVEVLQGLLSPRAIVERNDIGSRKFEGLPDAQGVLAGTLDGPVEVTLNGLKFTADLAAGHKTGLYLDQQMNWPAVANLIQRRPEAQVLDAFSFTGGFALHAARAGAGRVHLLDQSEEALAAAGRHAEANGLADRCSYETTNVFDWLKNRTTTPLHEKLIHPFDAVILDPPSFTRNRASLPNALRGYKEIHVRALKLIRRGGLLATFCCSHHVDAVTFQDVILSAAFDSRRWLRRVAVFSQAPDHPVIPAIPETEYLKGYAFEVVR
ncbi:MAG: class I SAM-dependent rRNA methyltransferase [Limisphaerales bacterium]